MKDIGSRLREMRIKNGLTQDELAEQLKCGAKAISRYESDENLSKVYDFIRVCECLGDVSYIITGKEYSNGKEITPEEKKILSAYKNLNNSDKQKIVDFILGIGEYDANKVITSEPTTIYRFPVFRQEAAAGVGRLDVSDAYSMEEFAVDNIPNEAAFIMEIAGESMYDEKTDYLIHTGSKVLIDPQINKYSLDEKIVIANFRGKTICKRYIVKDTYILFQSDNEAFEKENRKSTDDPDHKIIGVVLGVIESKKFVPVK